MFWPPPTSSTSPGRRCGFDRQRQRCSRSWELWSDGIGGEAELGDEDSTPRRPTPSMMRPFAPDTSRSVTLPPIIMLKVEKVENPGRMQGKPILETSHFLLNDDYGRKGNSILNEGWWIGTPVIKGTILAPWNGRFSRCLFCFCVSRMSFCSRSNKKWGK